MPSIPRATAKEQLVRINKLLTKPRVLIGGLAVQQYYAARDSVDIDLVCDEATARELIKSLYPTRDFIVIEKNEDDFRPAFEITHRANRDRVIFIGPKLTERDPYKYVDWNALEQDSHAFKYKKQELEQIRVPNRETLAFTKLLSFLNRVAKNRLKGEQDLIDFINLSNGPEFRLNAFADLIRQASCEGFVRDSLQAVHGNYDPELWRHSVLYDLAELLMPAFRGTLAQDAASILDNYAEVFGLDRARDFYDLIAEHYDDRNSTWLYAAHQAVIDALLTCIGTEPAVVVDVGCGTGRQIASHFAHSRNLTWKAIDTSQYMLAQFRANMGRAAFAYTTAETRIDNINVSQLENASVVLLSLVLTSLPDHTVLERIASTASETGTHVIVADIHPSTTLRKPFYDFALPDGRRVALKPCPVYPDKILETMMKSGLQVRSHTSVKDNSGHDYAFVSHFAPW